jgi:hypothetical protein
MSVSGERRLRRRRGVVLVAVVAQASAALLGSDDHVRLHDTPEQEAD